MSDTAEAAEAVQVPEIEDAAETVATDGRTADSEIGTLNPDGLVAAQPASLQPTASEPLHPAAPPPSQQQFEPVPGPRPSDELYWDQHLTALSDKLRSAEMLQKPDQTARVSAQREETDTAAFAAAVPAGRRGKSPYPLYEPPDGVDLGEAGEPPSQRGYQETSPHGALYERYQYDEPVQDEGNDGYIPEADFPEGEQTPRAVSPRSGGGDDAISDVSGAGDVGGRPEKPLLPPDHPLMARFQKALAGLLRKQIGKLDLDLVELRKEQRARAKHRESLGVQLYERQLQLARQQQLQKQLQQQASEAAGTRTAAEEALREVRRQHKEAAERLQADRHRERQLRSDVAALEKNEYHLRSLESDADTELQLRQKMAERAETEMSKLPRLEV